MHLRRLELSGFKSFAKKTTFDFTTPIVSVVGPNGSGKSNVAEAIRFVLGEQSMKSMRGKRGEDMIWNGSNAVPRMGKAAATITFDNQTRFLDLDFDEVTIERVVHRDGVNEYRMNGSQVRLKDVLEIMAGANIGASGHHIISQGEADKILSASPRERREMLEDALGLKVYQYRKDEATRKLDKTEENMRQVEALMREIQPHLKFLRRQVEKLKKTEALRGEGLVRFREYFAREEIHLTTTKKTLEKERNEAMGEVEESAQKMRDAKAVLEKGERSEEADRIVSLSEELESIRRNREAALRDASRLSGSIEMLSKRSHDAPLKRIEVEAIIKEGEDALSSAGSIESLRALIETVLKKMRTLLSGAGNDDEELAALREERDAATARERELGEKEVAISQQLESIRTLLDEAQKEERAKERELFELSTREREARHRLSLAEGELSRLKLEESEYQRELAEAGALFGRGVLDWKDVQPAPLTREEHEREKRELEKIKIRLEEMGAGGGEEILKEHREQEEREAFLQKELEDLSSSASSLKEVIVELDKELSERFFKGLSLINAEFTRLFSRMFDGGSASLKVVEDAVRKPRSLIDENNDGIPDEMEEAEVGVDIALSIPRKRIRSLAMLSGGERALTSIALIFAMSSVNPPPFLILDETDAALDEANSRRYGDMVEALADKSQLILITHNRETMSRAGILYGVTMGDDGVSKVLSVQLEDAMRVAK